MRKDKTPEQQKEAEEITDRMIRDGLAGILTPDQQKDRERLDRYIIREGLVSVMNDTKWREVVQMLEDETEGISFRAKTVRGSEPAADYWDSGFPYHFPHYYKAIEWIEFKTSISIYHESSAAGKYYTGKWFDNSERVTAALEAKSIPFHLAEGVIRIQGYTRPGKPAD